MKQCRIGFCGAGKWVKDYHIPELQKKSDQYEITGFYDLFREKAQEAAAGKYRVFHSLAELADDPGTDVVIVATKPVETHFKNTMMLLDAGKHVILEKPMTYSSEECDALIAKAREKGVLFTVNHNLRCSICLKATQEVLRQGFVGDPVCVEIVSPRSWYDEHDFSNYAVHMVDQALALNRSPLTEVTAYFVHPENPMSSCGYGEALLRFEKPPVIRISIKPLPQQQAVADPMPFRGYFRFYLCGTKDTFAIDDLGHIPNAADLLSRQYYYFDNREPDFSRPEFLDGLGKNYFDFFYDTWANGAPLLVTPEDGRNAIRCIELMNESARKGCAVKADGMLSTENRSVL